MFTFVYNRYTACLTIAFSRYLTMDYFKFYVQNTNGIAYLYFAEILWSVMNINTKEVENCDSSLSYYKLTCIRIVLHINHAQSPVVMLDFFLPWLYFPRLGALFSRAIWLEYYQC